VKLALFDIDGTLSDTAGRYDRVYSAAVSAHLGVEVELRLASFPDVTDSGIARALFRTHRGRDPSAAEARALHDAYLAALRRAGIRGRAVPGARDAVRRLAATDGWFVAVATGNWAEPGRLKLRNAGLRDDLPLGSADDHESRAEILRRAVERAAAHYGVEEFARVVYVGDGAWDVVATRALGLPFVGIATDGDLARLRRLGASHVLEHFADFERFVEALHAATPPLTLS